MENYNKIKLPEKIKPEVTIRVGPFDISVKTLFILGIGVGSLILSGYMFFHDSGDFISLLVFIIGFLICLSQVSFDGYKIHWYIYKSFKYLFSANVYVFDLSSEEDFSRKRDISLFVFFIFILALLGVLLILNI